MTSGSDPRLRVSEVLRLYAQGRRDFRELDIGPAEETFENKRLDDADFSSSFIDASFAGASLRRANFVNANVKGCNFDRTDLSEASFEGAALDSATFVRAEVGGTRFTGASWQSHVFSRGEFPPDAFFGGSLPPVGRHTRFRRALTAAAPVVSLHALACELRDEGESQSDVLGLFDLFRSDQSTSADETLYDAILQVMDLLTGWCGPDAAIFQTRLSRG